MFDFDVGKLLIFGIVALAVIPPKDLPRVMRTVGQVIGKMRRMAAEFQGQFMEAMKEADLESVKKEFDRPRAIRQGRRGVRSGDGDAPGDHPGRRGAQGDRPLRSGAERRRRGGWRRSRSRQGAIAPREDAAAAAQAVASRRAAERRRLGDAGRGGMSAEDIDATKAPLMDHLIELRMRLIRALYAFFAAFLVCFYFSRSIYNILTEPYVRVVGAEKAKLIATHFLEQFYTNIRLSMFGAARHRLSDHRRADLQVRRAGPLQARAAGVPALSHRDADLLLRRGDAGLFRRHAAADPVLGLVAAGQRRRARRRSSCCPRSANICR